MVEGPKDLVPEGVQEDQPLETPGPPLVSNPINTTFSLVGDPNFVDFVDPTQVKALFWYLSISSHLTNLNFYSRTYYPFKIH